MDTEGLFRVSAETNSIKELYELITTNNPSEVSIPPQTSPHVVASVIKQLLRNSEPCLIPTEVMEELYVTIETKNISNTKVLLESIQSYQYIVLKKLIIFLNKVTEKSTTNLMDVRNIAIVFSPSFMTATDIEDSSNNFGTLVYLQTQKKISNVIEYLLTQHKFVFRL